MSTLYNELRHLLLRRYEAGEAKAIALLVLEEAFGVTPTDVYADKVRHFSEEESRRWQNILQQLDEGRPVQQVLGLASFAGRSFRVTADTLIPRPETEELVDIAAALAADIAARRPNVPLRLLDGGTGTGCIAITLALLLEERHLPADVEACDLSSAALVVARDNARRLGAAVDFFRHDLLGNAALPQSHYDLIVSNPPYVMESERADMAPHVVDYEPSMALFVPDEDALRFYRALARLAADTLRPAGALAVEINRALAAETAEVMRRAGLEAVTVRRDTFGNHRFVTARKPV